MKSKSKPIVPRKADASLNGIDGLSHADLSTAQRRAVEKAELKRDSKFAERFSTKALSDMSVEVFAAFGDRILNPAFAVNSQEAIDADRRAATCWLAYLDAERLEFLVPDSSPQELRAMRLAFEAGASWAEARAENRGQKPGRRAVKDRLKITLQILAENPGADAVKLMQLWPNTDAPNSKNAANLVSQARKLSRKQ